MASPHLSKKRTAAAVVSPKVILRKYLSMWVDGKTSIAAQVLEPQVIRHHPASIQPPEISGLDAYAAYIAEFRKLHSELRIEARDMVAHGNLVAYRYSASALNPATNKRFTFGGIAMSRLSRAGKIAEEWITWDTFDLMVQVGIVPPREH